MLNSSPLAPGTQIHEYVIEDVLGVGAFGITYRATDTLLGIPVVIKEYFPVSFARRDDDNSVSAISDEKKETFLWGRQRFLDEAKILAKFHHLNIVRVNRYFMANDTAYFVMDFEVGETLQDVLSRTEQPLGETEIIDIFTQVLNGLGIVHQQKYLHRDIKPGNIYVRNDKTVMLIDFGAARHQIRDDGSMTVQLTPGYAPVELYVPEDRKGPWTDLYSVGASIYRCLMNEIPPVSIERLKKMEDFGADPCPKLARDLSHLGSQMLLDSVDWMMSVAAAERPQTVQEVLDVWAGKRHYSNSVTPLKREPVKIQYKLLIAGSPGSCIPTALQAMREAGPVAKGNAGKGDDSSQSLSLDFVNLDISSHERMLVCAVPGREQLNIVRDRLQEGAMGLVLLIDNARENPLDDLDFFLDLLSDFIGTTGMVIGINRSELHPGPNIHDYHLHIAKSRGAGSVPPPIMEVAPGNPRELKKLLLSLLFHLNPSL